MSGSWLQTLFFPAATGRLFANCGGPSSWGTRRPWRSIPTRSGSKVTTLAFSLTRHVKENASNANKSPPTGRVLPVLRDAAAEANQHAAAGPFQRADSRRDGLHAPDGHRALRQHHAGAQIHAAAHAARLPQHQHGAQHQHHTGGAGGPLLCHGQEVSGK